MNKKLMRNILATTVLTAGLAPLAQASVPSGIFITEFMGKAGASANGFVEITNLTASFIDLSEFGYYKTGMDSSNGPTFPGTSNFDASKVAQIMFTNVAPGESVILTTACDSAACEDELGEKDFHKIWGLNAAVKVQTLDPDRYYGLVPSSEAQLSLYRLSDGMLIDQVNYSTALTQSGVSASAGHDALGLPYDATGWVKSSVGDTFGSKMTTAAGYAGAIGNPGLYVSPAPEPETYAMMLAGLSLVALAKRRRKQIA